MVLLIENGVVIGNNRYLVKIICFICDTPARAGLKGIIQHTGYDHVRDVLQEDLAFKIGL